MGSSPTILYPMIMLASVLTAVAIGWRRDGALGLSRHERTVIRIGAFCGAMIGAKLPFALSDLPGLLSGRVWLENGKTIVFGLVGGYLGVEITKAWLGVRVKTGDSFAVPVAAAVGVGRMSCFVAGCCHGTATRLPWGVDFGDGVRRHPTQVYEMIFHSLAAVALAFCERRGWFIGQRFKLYLISYLIYRFLSETIRPEPIMAGGLTGYQWACLGLIPPFLGLWWGDARQIRKNRIIGGAKGTPAPPIGSFDRDQARGIPG